MTPPARSTAARGNLLGGHGAPASPVRARLAARWPVRLAELTTFRIGGWAREFHAPATLAELRELVAELHSAGERPFFLGRGANVLFPDGEYARPVISMRALRGCVVDGRRVRVEAGVRLGRLISLAIRSGLSGLEGMVGIPATVGGAAAMNAGGHGGTFGERVARLGLLPLDGGAEVVLEGREVPWRYRSFGLEGYAVAWAELELASARASDVRRVTSVHRRRKQESQPLTEPSAGCIFRNPAGDSAGRLIDELRLKGTRHGGAEVSPRHGNFIVNATGSACAADVVALVDTVRRRVEEARGVRLETELVFA